MPTLKQQPEKRRHNRYKVYDGVIALTSDFACKVSNISESGLALECIAQGVIPPRFSVQILMKRQSFHANVPVIVAWEKETEFSAFSSIFTKSVGVKFNDLTHEEKCKIDCLVEIHKEFGS